MVRLRDVIALSTDLIASIIGAKAGSAPFFIVTAISLNADSIDKLIESIDVDIAVID